MLKHGKRIMALVLALVMSFALTACGEENAADIAQKVETKLNTITSMEAKMDMQLDLTIAAEGQTQSMNTSTVANITSFNDPIQMKMDMHMNMDAGGQSQAIDMESYAVQENGALVMYNKSFDTWQKQTITAEELLGSMQQYDAQENLNLYLENADSFQVSTEQLNGVEVYRLKGILSGESLKKAVEATGAMDQLGQMADGAEEMYEVMFKDLGDMPITIWADKKDLTPVRYEMDMAQTMQTMMKNLITALAAEEGMPEDFEINCTAFKITMDMFNFNNATPITVPQEALDSTK